MTGPVCPLCDAPVDGDDALRAHLAAVHDLRDDPGTTSQLAHLETLIPATRGATAVAAEPVAPPVLRVYDPRADDERWRPIVLGVGGLLLLVLAVVAMSLN